jgi:murein DD-endopeptidase MepM/ murein hydrolase activator NlpD
MPLKQVLALVGATVLFGVGVAAAFADSPPATTDTTTTDTTTTEQTTTTVSTTTPSPSPTTTTTTTTSAPPTTAPARRVTVPTHELTRPRLVPKSPPARHARHKKRGRKSRPLKVTPPLGQSHFVFPVVGDAGYIDTYGDFRGDVHGKWHHGDDIFAPLGTPLVAVASGTINRVGWRKAGGWRIWVRDSAGDYFYYAHLSGYARSVFHSNRVRAGQVIGFLGNTGDAFPGAPHLHFEIHPRQLLSLEYDGAVDPTSYLDGWTHLDTVSLPLPVHPRLPKSQAFKNQALVDFRDLLAARQAIETATQPLALGFRPDPDRVVAQALPIGVPTVAATSGDDSAALGTPLLAGLASIVLGGLSLQLGRLALRRLRQETVE